MSTSKANDLAFWSMLGFAAISLGYFWYNADAPDVYIISVVAVLWLTGPVAASALLVARANDQWSKWAYYAAEIAVMVWHVFGELDLRLNPDAQNGIATMLRPLWQYAALFVYYVVATASRDIRGS